MDELLQAQYQEIKQDLFQRIKHELVSHMDAEDNVVYTHLIHLEKSKENVQNLSHTSDRDHHQIRELLQKLNLFEFDTPKWWAVYKELQVSVKKHCETEEQELLPELTEDFSKIDLVNMGNEIEKTRQYPAPY